MNKTEAITFMRAFMEAAGLTNEDLVKPPKEPTVDDLCPRKRWVPKNGSRYYRVTSFGQVRDDTWVSGAIDDHLCLALGNVFRTEESAREHIENMKAWVELRERSCEYIGASFHTVSLNGWTLPGVRFKSKEARDLAVEAVGGMKRIEKLINWVHNK